MIWNQIIEAAQRNDLVQLKRLIAEGEASIHFTDIQKALHQHLDRVNLAIELTRKRFFEATDNGDTQLMGVLNGVMLKLVRHRAKLERRLDVLHQRWQQGRDVRIISIPSPPVEVEQTFNPVSTEYNETIAISATN